MTAALVFLGLYLGWLLLYSYSAGLDLQNPAELRRWVRVCARGQEAEYCRAADRVLTEVDSPAVLLLPYSGDRASLAAMTALYSHAPTPAEAEAVVRANLFAVPQLHTGRVQALDGQWHDVVCPLPDQKAVCQIGRLRGGPQDKQGGQVVEVWTDTPGQPDFLRPVGFGTP